MKRLILLAAATLGIMLPALPANAQVSVRFGPPPPRYERIPPPPGPGYSWRGGSWSWNGVRYVWVPGAYTHRRGHWVPAHWVHRPHGWFRVEGHWAP